MGLGPPRLLDVSDVFLVVAGCDRSPDGGFAIKRGPTGDTATVGSAMDGSSVDIEPVAVMGVVPALVPVGVTYDGRPLQHSLSPSTTTTHI